MYKRFSFITALAVTVALLVTALPEKSKGDSQYQGQSILKAKCAKCHNLTGSPKTMPKTITEALNRKAPDLYYAGTKYNGKWLNAWLINPTRLRPAGYRYFDHIKAGHREDLIKANSLTPHMKLSRVDAASVTKTLMTFKAKENLIIKGKYVQGNIDMYEGEMYFDKLSGCLACHQIEPDFGGLSGPEVYTVGRRLKADYVYSYIKNPQDFDKYTLMPNKELSDKVLQILTDYMMGLKD